MFDGLAFGALRYTSLLGCQKVMVDIALFPFLSTSSIVDKNNAFNERYNNDVPGDVTHPQWALDLNALASPLLWRRSHVLYRGNDRRARISHTTIQAVAGLWSRELKRYYYVDEK